MKALRIGIAGLGTVGRGVVCLLQDQKTLLRQRAGRSLEIVALSAKNRSKGRGSAFEGLSESTRWYDDARELAVSPDVDVVVELIGGDQGVAHEVCERALKAGKHVVTANKALIARHGVYLAGLAEQHQVSLKCEAAVAGGIPVLKVLSEGLAGNQISKISGIMNGTCNYILTQMYQTGEDFDSILREAQDLGYAEADPAFDIDGVDTAHKLSILTSLAFGTPVKMDGVYIEGIRGITQDDIRYSRELGYTIKLLGICRSSEQGIEQSVYPTMLPDAHPLAVIEGVNNAVLIEGHAVGQLMLMGAGAGSLPTASAVVADIVDIAAERFRFCFNRPVAELKTKPDCSIEHHACPYYMRLHVEDKTGVLARITDILGTAGISMESLLQKPAKTRDVHIAGITHVIKEGSIKKAVSQLAALGSVLDAPHVIRVER